jgi:hypothetical protein
MGRKDRCYTLLMVAVLAGPAAALAQERGRTDGPEGSEYGKGGYSRAGGGNFSLGLDWGAALEGGPASGPPLFVGVTAGYWGDEWFVLEASGAYLLNSERVNLLVGPRFRTAFWPVSFSVGLKAGAITSPAQGLRFGLSPELGFDTVVGDHVLLGLGYALDLPLGGLGAAHRIFMKIGYRF